MLGELRDPTHIFNLQFQPTTLTIQQLLKCIGIMMCELDQTRGVALEQLTMRCSGRIVLKFNLYQKSIVREKMKRLNRVKPCNLISDVEVDRIRRYE